MKRFMQVLLATFGVLALAFAGCNSLQVDDTADTDDTDDEAVVEDVVEDEEATE